MYLFKQQAIFQLDQLPYPLYGLLHSSASIVGGQGWEDEPSHQRPGLAEIAERREQEMEIRACQNPLLLVHTSEITIILHGEKLCGLQNCCWIF